MGLVALGEITIADQRVDLCSYVLRGSAEDALSLLARARSVAVDPLDYCVGSAGLDEDQVLDRAARWAGVAFAADVPQAIRGSASHLRTDTLANARAIVTERDGTECHYFSPRLEDVVALRQSRERGGLRYNILLTPRRALRRTLVEANAPALLAEARQRLSRRWPHASASLDLSRPLRAAFVAALAAIVAFTAAAPLIARPLLLPFLLVVIVAPALLRLLATFHRPPQQLDPPLTDEALPRYSVLVPLRDEAGMVPQLCDALRAIDYPPEKLEIIVLVESRSPDTVAAVQAQLGDTRFELMVIPDALPHTKPKALDYALPLVSGDHVVVFDAEDIPDRDQLRRAAARFAAHPEFDCLQAELRIDNGAENWLTALFSGEYAGLFGLLLPYLAEHRLPLPLGWHQQPFPDVCPARGRRLGRLQRHRGCRSRCPAGPHDDADRDASFRHR